MRREGTVWNTLRSMNPPDDVTVTATIFSSPSSACGSAWNVDPLSGGIGVQN